MTSLLQPEKSSAQRGHARLTVEMVSGQSAVTAAQSASPLKILTPQARGASVWAFTSSFGGGLVAGDQTRLDLKVAKDARCFVGTQASTKIYRNPSRRPCSHHTRATVQENALLVFAPDPVQAFAESAYTQRQEFFLAESSNLVLADWFTAGRAARGERWSFSHLQSRNEIFVAGRRIFLDSILLNAESGFTASPHQAGRFNCFALLFVCGKLLASFTENLLAEISARPVERRGTLACSASPVADGALLRIAGENVEEVGRTLHHHLNSVAPLLDDDPWRRKW